MTKPPAPTRTLQSFMREDVPCSLLRGASYPHLTRLLILDWGMIFACWWLMLNTSPLLYPIWGLVVAGRLHAFGVILHELSHQKLNRKKLGLRALEFFSGYFISSSANAMAYHHIRHHRHTLMNEDPYYKVTRKCTGSRRFWLSIKQGLLFQFFWTCRTLVAPLAVIIPKFRTSWARIFLADVSGKDLTQSQEVLTCAKEDVPIALFQCGLLYLTLTRFEFLIYGYYLLLPIAGVFCIYRLLVEHEYDIVENRSVYQLIESTFDHHTNWWEKLFFGPHNIGYHCMHHIHPTVGIQALPALRDWYLKNSQEYQGKYGIRKAS